MTTLHELDKPEGIAKPKPGFTLTETGFLIEFENGHGLSVQWGKIHMCTNYKTKGADHKSHTAECLESTPSGRGQLLHGHCSPEYVLKLLRKMERRQTPE